MEYKILKKNHSNPIYPKLTHTRQRNFLLHNFLVLTHKREHEKRRKICSSRQKYLVMGQLKFSFFFFFSHAASFYWVNKATIFLPLSFSVQWLKLSSLIFFFFFFFTQNNEPYFTYILVTSHLKGGHLDAINACPQQARKPLLQDRKNTHVT